jgi:hypothetical protein
VPAPGRWERLGWYAGAVVATCVLLAAGLRLDAIDIRAPLAYDGDVLLIMPMVKATVETGIGGHWRNERLGYPGVQELYDFPVIDHLHFAILWALGKVVRNWVIVYNLYYLLTWPLTTLTCMFAFRRLGLTLPMAAAGGILYAFLPYHFMRGESHYFLSAYWVIPLSWLPALGVLKGEFPFFRRDADGRYRLALKRWGTLWQVLLAAATAAAGAYYAFFACAIYAAVGLYGWILHRTWKAAVSIFAVAALVSAFGILHHLPTIIHSYQYGRNEVTKRLPGEAESHGLKIAHLLLPVDGHNVVPLRQLKSRYSSFDRPLQNENSCATLGAVGSAGFLWLTAVLLFLPGRRGWPYGPLAVVSALILLYATIGGFSSLFNLLVFDQIRCPNRVSVYLAFICLFAVLYPLDRFLVTRTGRARWLRYPAVAGLVALGVADQTPDVWFTGHIVRITDDSAQRFWADHRFFERVEEMMPPGARVFSCPYIPYPEEPPMNGMNTYEHARGYMHTNTLVWGYGAMKNRETDVWHESVAHDARDQILRRLVVSGFDGLVIDERGFNEAREGEVLINDLRRAAGVNLPTIYHEDGRQAFLDLRPYRDWLRAQDPVRFEEWARAEREWVALTWINGFYPLPASYGRRHEFRWAAPSATAVIVNPSDRPRKFLFAATFGVDWEDEPFLVRINAGTVTQLNRTDGPGPWADDFILEKQPGDWTPPNRNYGERKEYVLEVPPGRHTVKFRCVPPRYFLSDARNACYYLKDIRFIELK